MVMPATLLVGRKYVEKPDVLRGCRSFLEPQKIVTYIAYNKQRKKLEKPANLITFWTRR